MNAENNSTDDLLVTIIQGTEPDDLRLTTPTKLETTITGKSKRNTFACVGCHTLKQKCVPSDNNNIYLKPCQRCLRQKKKCTFDLAKRTRKRKSNKGSNKNASKSDEASPSSSLNTMTNTNKTTDVNTDIDNSGVNSNLVSPTEGLPFQSSSMVNLTQKRPFDNISGDNLPLNMNYDYPNNFSDDSTNLKRSITQLSISDLAKIKNLNDVYKPNAAALLTDLQKSKQKNVISSFNDKSTMKNTINNTSSNINNWLPISRDNSQTDLTNTNNSKLSNSLISNILASPNLLPITSNLSITQNESNNDSRLISNVNNFNDNNKMNNFNVNKPSNFNFDRKDSLVFPKRIKLSNGKLKCHMNHAFKKNLRSLLILLKDKLTNISQRFSVWSNEWNKLVESSMFLPTISDPVSIGIISMDEAQRRLDIYRSHIMEYSRSSFVGIPETFNARELRQSKPILFSVIVSIVSVAITESDSTRDTAMRLDSFVINLISMQIFKLNNKSVEVIEALVTLCMWYNFLEWSQKTRYHLFNYICTCLTKDLGPTGVNRSFGMFDDEDPDKYRPLLKTPLEAVENGPELSLTVYISSLNISIYLRQNAMARWSKLHDGALKVIETKILKLRNGPMTDVNKKTIEEKNALIVFAKLNHSLEKIHIHLHEMSNIEKDDQITNDILENYTSKLLVKYKKELDELFLQIPSHRIRMLSFYYSVEAYLHQYTLTKFLSELYQGTAKECMETTLPESVKHSFFKCYECCSLALKNFLKMPPVLVASLPLYHFSRIIYTVGMLILKLRYIVVALPPFHQLIDYTEDTISTVKQVSKKLEEASKLYPFNTALLKFQYVVALYGESYATKVTDLAEKTEVNEARGILQFNDKFLESRPVDSNVRSSIDKRLMRNTNAMTTTNNNITTDGNNIVSDILNDNSNKLLNDTSSAVGTGGTTGTINGTLNSSNNQSFVNDGSPLLNESSPTISNDNLNDYLTDINSLAMGYNALNDEFWTDLLFDNM